MTAVTKHECSTLCLIAGALFEIGENCPEPAIACQVQIVEIQLEALIKSSDYYKEHINQNNEKATST